MKYQVGMAHQPLCFLCKERLFSLGGSSCGNPPGYNRPHLDQVMIFGFNYHLFALEEKLILEA